MVAVMQRDSPDGCHPLVFSDAFSRPDVVTDPGRELLLACLLGRQDAEGTDGAKNAPHGQALATAPLHDVVDPKRRRELRDCFEEAFGCGWERRAVASVRLGELFPGARRAPDASFGPRQVDAHLRSSLSSLGVARWSGLLAVPLEEVARAPGFGRTAVTRLLGACFERSLVGLVEETVTDAGDGLTVLLQAERRRATQPVLESLLETAIRLPSAGNASSEPDSDPDSVSDTARRLLARSAPWATVLEAPLLGLLEAVAEEQDLSIFFNVELGTGARASLVELGSELGVSSSRIAQRRDRAAAEIRQELAASPAPLEWLVGYVRRSLGTAARCDETGELLSRCGLAYMSTEGQARRAAELLLWLAGPYRLDARVGGWLLCGPDDLVVATRRMLSDDDGIRSLGDVGESLRRLGLSDRVIVPWVHACGSAVVDGELCAWLAGALPDVLERLLEAHGRAVTVQKCEELLASGGRRTGRDDLERTLGFRRFRSLPEGSFELAAWPAADSARSSVRRSSLGPSVSTGGRLAGSPARAERDREDKDESWQPGLPGIDSAAGAGDGGGASVSWSPWPEVSEVTSEHGARGSAPSAPGADRAWFIVEVDDVLLGGDGSAAPEVLVRALGVGWRQRRTFVSRYGPVTIANDGSTPTHSPLRPVALGAGAEPGDSLVLGFSAAGDVVVEVRRRLAGGLAAGPAVTGGA